MKDNKAKHTMRGVDRKDASIEVEDNETGLGDLNGDSFLELMTFKGKKHSQGGIPVDIPDGSFVFSDDKSAIIKDEQIYKDIFGMSKRKKGYTPADISKKFQLNDFMEKLKDKDATDLERETSNLMIKNNLKKLGQLSMVQESMKGMPNGTPQIAKETLGIMKAGGPVKTYLDPKGDTLSNEQVQKMIELGFINDSIPPEYNIQSDENKPRIPYDRSNEPDYESENKFTNTIGNNDFLRKAVGLFSSGNDNDNENNNDYKSLFKEKPSIGQGFYGDVKAADEFRQRMSIEENELAKGAYNEFLKAINSDKVDVVKAAQNWLNEADVDWSWGMFGNSDQDKLQDLSGVLDEKLYNLGYDEQLSNIDSYVSKLNKDLSKVKDNYSIATIKNKINEMIKFKSGYLNSMNPTDRRFNNGVDIKESVDFYYKFHAPDEFNNYSKKNTNERESKMTNLDKDITTKTKTETTPKKKEKPITKLPDNTKTEKDTIKIYSIDDAYNF